MGAASQKKAFHPAGSGLEFCSSRHQLRIQDQEFQEGFDGGRWVWHYHFITDKVTFLPGYDLLLWSETCHLQIHMCVLSRFSLFDSVSLWTVAHQASLSMRILQATILEWVAMSSSRGSSQPRDWTHVSMSTCIGRWGLYHQHHLGSPYSVWRDSCLSERLTILSQGIR